MKECYLCGIDENKTLLYEGIHKKHGIVNVCRKCYFKEKIPLIEKKEVNGEALESKATVRQRLSKMARLVPRETQREPAKRAISNGEEVSLNDLIEKNFKKDSYEKSNPPEEMIDNFNWVVMRKRRALKLSKEQLAKVIKEPVVAIESIEKGELPRDYKPLVKKLERFFNVSLTKNGNTVDYHDIVNESKVPTGILMSELKEKEESRKSEYLDVSDMNLERINELYGVPSKNEKVSGIPQRKRESQKGSPDGLSDEDISGLVWGK